MKCIHCLRQWGDNAIPTVCTACLKRVPQLDEEDHVVISDETEIARRKARLESTTADNIHL